MTNNVHVQTPVTPLNSSPPIRSSGKPFHIAYYVNYDKFYVKHKQFLAAIMASDEPISFLQANKSPGKTTLGCKLVYKLKFKDVASVERFKGRLVVLENRQIAGIDIN